MYEELMNDEEIQRAIELPNYFVVRPAILPNFRNIDYVYPGLTLAGPPAQPYNSKTTGSMSKDELRAYLRSHPTLLGEAAGREF